MTPFDIGDDDKLLVWPYAMHRPPIERKAMFSEWKVSRDFKAATQRFGNFEPSGRLADKGMKNGQMDSGRVV